MKATQVGASRLLAASVLAVLFLFTPDVPNAQNLLSNPESIVWDAERGYYLVSNWEQDGPGDPGTIVRMNEDGTQSMWNDDLANEYQIAGIYIYGDSLLAAAGVNPNAGIAVYSLETAELVDLIVLPDVGLPNDITSDENGVIYVTDYWGDKLYRIIDGVPSVYFDAGLHNPNGIHYDRANRRLLTLAAGLGGCPVMATSLEDSTISLIVYTGFSGYDGIVADSEGRIYISEWTTDSIHRYDAPFTSGHTVFSSGHTDPADIYYDAVHDMICIPNFTTHDVDFVPVTPTEVEEDPGDLQGLVPDLPRSHPNPCFRSTSVEYELDAATNVRIVVYDIMGRVVRRVADAWRASGLHREAIDLSGLAAGIYPFRVDVRGGGGSGTIVLMR